MNWDEFTRAQAAHRAFSAFLAKARWITWLNYTVLAWTIFFTFAWWWLGLRRYWTDGLGAWGATLFQFKLTFAPLLIGGLSQAWAWWRLRQLKRQFPPG